MENRKVILETKGLKQHFPTGKTKNGEKLFVKANDGIDMVLYEGETIGIVGESGCGKSTFGRSLLKLYTPTAGRIIYNGKDITDLSTKEMIPLRQEMQ
ncbi:MAG: ATP-binding cassette domain-containing protein, partial [Psychrilyobacter sp.]|nr:ATP-binding cassette domain-containing protein [Psychrilyobacter sp.]